MHDRDPPADVVEYEQGRARRQAVALSGALLLMLGLAALGIWVVVASHQQYPGRLEAWVGTAFGVLFSLLGLAVALTAVELLQRIRRLAASPRPLLLLDPTGITGADGRTVPWEALARIEATADAPPPHRTSRVAQLDPGHRASLGVKRGLDRAVGGRLGLRDGRRSVRLLLRDGGDLLHDLTLPVGPARFDAVVGAIDAHAQQHAVPLTLPR